MSWRELYNEKKCSAEEAVTLIKDEDRVVTAHAVAEPPALVDALNANIDNYKNVEICHMISYGSAGYCEKSVKDNVFFNSLFTSANTRKSIEEGQGQFTPVFFHEIPSYFKRGILPIDVFMVQVTPPDEHGYCSIGVASDYSMQAIESSKIVLAQVNDQVPYTYGDCYVHISKIDRIVEESQPVISIAPAVIDDMAKTISEYCIDLIDDESTLQVGIGAIPEAITRGLTGKKDLGVHSELVTDALMDLYESGAISNEAKSMDKGKMVVTFLMGTQKLYDFVDHNPAIELRRVDYVNHPCVIAQCSKMVSINSAIEVDFMGQVVSDSIGTKQFSGVGGQVDFVRGASMSQDGLGKSIIALPSSTTKKDGTRISKITPYITHGAAVTTSRNDVDTIVTEYGVAVLKGKSIQERARRLIKIAHPEFRDELATEFEKRFNVSF